MPPAIKKCQTLTKIDDQGLSEEMIAHTRKGSKTTPGVPHLSFEQWLEKRQNDPGYV